MHLRAAGFVAAVSLLAIALMINIPSAKAQTYGPRLMIQEDTSCSYYYNGTVKTQEDRSGQFFVAVPNDDDVLQYIKITLAGYGDTDIDWADGAYHDVAVSSTDPPSWDWQQLYVNTSGDDAAASYTITDEDKAPTLNLSLSYSNQRGGTDLYDEANIEDPDNNITIDFSITNPSGTVDFIGVDAHVFFNVDTSGSYDVEVIGTSAQSGTASPEDSDSDTINDYVDWTGIDILKGTTVNLTVVINLTSGAHLGAATSVNLQEAGYDGMNATYSNTSFLFSGLAASDKFSRGPVRLGVDLSSNAGTWYARGFVRNMGDASGGGYNLTYNVSEWRIYEIDPTTGQPYSQQNQTGAFNKSLPDSQNVLPSDLSVYTNDYSRSSNTTLYNTSSSSKPFVSVYFDWEVIWNSTGSEANVTYSNSSMDLLQLYLVDLTLQKEIEGTISPNVGGENITINETVVNVGDNITEPHFVQILSYVPSNTSGGSWRGSGWDIDDTVEVYLNDTYKLAPDNADYCFISVTDPTQSADGFVNLTIYDLPNCPLDLGGTVGHTFDENDYITISFVATSDVQMTTGDSYEFWSIGQLNSSSDTMDREYNLENKTVTVSGKRVVGYKDLIAYDTSIPTMINSTINLTVEDTVGSGISGLKFMDYVPSGTISYQDFVNNVTVFFSNSTGRHTWVYGQDYNITINGTVTLPDGLVVDAYEFVNESNQNGWNLSNGEYIEVSYQINYSTPGLYVLPVMIAAFDPDTGVSLRTAFYGIVKVSIPEAMSPLSIEEGDLVLSRTVQVGKPAIWSKGFDVFNPNPRPVSTRFEVEVFDDATDGYASYFDEQARRVEEVVSFSKNSQGHRVMQWDSVIGAMESRNYELRVLTPPVLEIDRDVEVLEQLPEKKVRLKMDVYLKSFAAEDYENVILNLPIGYDKVEEVRDGFGNKMAFTGGTESTSITVDSMEADQLRTVTVIYQESYPTIIITPDRDRYNLNSPVSLEILVINGGEEINYPYLEVEIYTPGMDVIFSNVEGLEGMDPLEKTEMYEKFVIPATAPSGNYIATARFREDFSVLASASGNFYVLGVEGGIPGAVEVLIVILISGILAYFSFRRLREVRSGRRYGGL